MKNEEKEKVVAVLADKDLKPAQKFNELLGLFRNHPQHPASTMRHLNAVGFTPMNLGHLEYDIKKLYGITDAEVATFSTTPQEPEATTKTQEQINAEVYALIKETFAKDGELDFTEKQKLHLAICEIAGEKEAQTEPEPVPEFSKGIAGNKEMLDWLKERNVEHKATKKAELLAEVEKQLHNEYDQTLTDYMATLKVWATEWEAWLAEQEATNTPEGDEPTADGDDTTTEGEDPAPDGDAPVNYDEMEYNDLKAAAAERAKQTGEAPADQKKVTLLEYLKKKA